MPDIKNMEYADRLRALKLLSLVYKILRSGHIETFKFKNQMYAGNSGTLLSLEKESCARENSQMLKKQRLNTAIRKHFLSLRVTDYWNGLPDYIIKSKTLNIFKNKIGKLYDNSIVIEFPIQTEFLGIYICNCLMYAV